MQTIGKMDDGRVLATLTLAECRAMEAVQMAAAGILEEISNVMNPTPAPAGAPEKTTTVSDADAEVESALKILGKVGTPARPKIIKITGAATEPLNAKRSPLNVLSCRTCGKPITRKKGRSGKPPKCCSEKCLKEFLRIYARENWRKRHGKEIDAPVRGAATVNPADPFLTDEQRKEIMARREKLIAASAQRHADG